ncbi:hypothetical protein P389DRAFT_187108 [Cystobasidium minutum MCA 4210]|uniref:uncharacterized protein n=1 Tax=Cystobasidium minutum MCA 4210 TaxID=1397322 RepID=UPI0034CE03FB|eukprot:jgi/Rhomi1/187108/estExt_fgenesh1_pg.C_1_t10379
MSFLLGRSHQQPQQQRASGYSNNSRNDSTVLYDASSDNEDDELEAAFGDSDARELDSRADYTARQASNASTSNTTMALNAYRPEGHSHPGEESINMDDHDSENDHLLHSSSSTSAGNAVGRAGATSSLTAQDSNTPRPRMTTTQTGSSSNSNPGGYDFEADPYERRSAPISLGADDDEDDDHHGHPSSRRPRNGRGASSINTQSGLLATIRNILPSRFRQYGVLGSDNRTASGRRTDGTTDHGDDDDDEDNEAWIAPPPSMPGIYGGGLSNDGVFANMAAKPGNSRSGGDRSDIVGGDDEAPEKEIPPAYELAVLDAAPPYFDTTVHAPGLGGIGGSGGVGSGLEEILIEGLPLGNPFSFFWSLLVSMSFQFVGFLLTTLLSTSHAAKNGSRAGLGVTLIQYGLYLGTEGENAFDAPVSDGSSGDGGKDEWAAFWGGSGGDSQGDAGATATGAAVRLVARTVINGLTSRSENGTATDPWRGPVLLDGGAAVSGVATSWLSMVLMIGGWFLLVSSLTSYLKAIRYAKALRDGSTSNPDSWLERGGPIGALYTRVTGREMPTFQQERTWGLAPRRIPRETTTDSDSNAPPAPPSDATRPTGFLPSLINRGATGVRTI